MSDFDDFWRIYDHKRGKALARAKFNEITSMGGLVTTASDKDGNRHRLVLQATPELLIEAAKAARQDWNDAETPEHFIPHASTWLNQGRWEDMDDDERREKAARYDRIKARMAERKLSVVQG